MQFPSRDLTNQFISLSYQDVVQRYNFGTASYFLDGFGFVIGYIPSISVGNQIVTVDQTINSASYALNASHSDLSKTASFSLLSALSETASVALVSTFSDTASLSSYSDYAGSSSFSVSASHAIMSDSASWSPGSGMSVSSSWASQSLSSSYTIQADFSRTASYAYTSSVELTIEISSSWASASLSASYSPIQLPDITNDTASHKIGIKKAIPYYTLDVNGTIGNSSGILYIDNNFGNIVIGDVGSNWDSNTLTIGHSDSYFYGKVGVGMDSSPSYTLDVNGSGHFYSDLNCDTFIYVTSGASIGGLGQYNIQIVPDGIFPINGADYAVQIGRFVSKNSTNSTYAVQIGNQAGQDSINGSYSVQIGSQAGQNSTNAITAVQIGQFAGYNATNAVGAVQIGSYAGYNGISASNATFIGTAADAVNITASTQKSIAIGYQAKVNGDNQCVIGGTGINAVKVSIGNTSSINTLDVVGNISCSVITASLYGTATTASFVTASNVKGTIVSSSYAFSASYAPPKTHVEFGILSGSAFSGSPQSYDIVYTNSFPNNIYSVSVIGDEARMWSTSNRSSTGFTINSNSNQPLTQMVMWRVEG